MDYFAAISHAFVMGGEAMWVILILQVIAVAIIIEMAAGFVYEAIFDRARVFKAV